MFLQVQCRQCMYCSRTDAVPLEVRSMLPLHLHHHLSLSLHLSLTILSPSRSGHDEQHIGTTESYPNTTSAQVAVSTVFIPRLSEMGRIRMTGAEDAPNSSPDLTI
jgi:hypothetical protein